MHEALSRALFDDAIGILTTELARIRGWTVHAAVYPLFDVTFRHPSRSTALRVQFECTGWNEIPPAVAFLSSDGAYLAALPPTPRGQFNNNPHPATGRPFLCMRGAREYHSYPGHVTDLWENYRDRPEYTLAGIVTQVWAAWLEGPA